jgi:hypothetical protein
VNEAVVWTARVAAVLLMLLVDDGTDGCTEHAPIPHPIPTALLPYSSFLDFLLIIKEIIQEIMEEISIFCHTS